MGLGDRTLVTLRLPFRLSFASSRTRSESPKNGPPAGNDAGAGDRQAGGVAEHPPTAPAPSPLPAAPQALAVVPPVTPAAVPVAAVAALEAPAAATRPDAPASAAPVSLVSAAAAASSDAIDASSRLVWLAYTSSLASRASTLEDAALAALEGRLEPAPRRRAARDTYKLATSLWLLEARDAARQAWEAAGLLETGTLLSTANALRLSQIVESLHQALRALPRPEALSPAGRATAPLLVVVDDDEALARELPIEAAVQGWRARVLRHLNEPLDEPAAVIMFGHDLVGEADAAARARLLAAHPNAPVAAIAAGPSVAERAHTHGVKATRTLCRPIAPAALVAEAIDMRRRRQAAPPVVLIGITDRVHRAEVRAALAGIGTVVEANDGADGVWHAATQSRAELCVLDEAMAGGAALHVARAIRRDWDIAPMSVMLLTNAADAATVARAADAGIDDCVPVSAGAVVLATAVRNRLDRARTQRLAADVDPVTRLPHLRSGVPMIERMVSIARRYAHPLSIIVAEVDGLPALHAGGGHESATRLSSLLGRRLARAFRADDFVAQAAPGRFVVAAFGMRSDDGVHRMAELLEGFREQSVEGADTVTGASFSAGLAQIRVDGADANALIRAAEEALTAAQGRGGNRVEAVTLAEASRIEWTADAILIDPDAPFAALVEHALETRGHRVRTLGDGREALDLLTHPETPIRARLIVLELGLPGLDGLSLLGQLAASGVLKATKVVVVTTRSVEAEMIKALELGAVDYITKPVSLPVLMRRLRSALSGSFDVS